MKKLQMKWWCLLPRTLLGKGCLGYESRIRGFDLLNCPVYALFAGLSFRIALSFPFCIVCLRLRQNEGLVVGFFRNLNILGIIVNG